MEDKDKKRDPMPPPDATPEEIGEFWDTHSLADYWDETHEAEFQVNLKSRQNLSPDEAGVVDRIDTLSTEQGWRKLKDLIQSIKPKEFEKFVAALLTSFLKIPFIVARSGDQPSGDARTLSGDVSMQAKNYSDRTSLDAKGIEGDVRQVNRTLQYLEVYILAVSRNTAQLRDTLDAVEEETGLDIVVLELTDEPSDLGALCVTFWEDIREFFDPSDISQQFLYWVGIQKDKLETNQKISKLQDQLKYGIQTQKHVQEDIEKYLLARFSRDKGFNPINLSQAINRDLIESKIAGWWEALGSGICYLEGEEGHGKSWLAAKCMKAICKNGNVVTFWLDSRDWRDTKSISDLLRSCFSLLPYEERKMAKLQNKPAKIWRKTLIILDGVNERNAIEAAQRILAEYFRNDESEWKDRIRFLLTTRPLDDYPDFERYLWSECHKISVDSFNDSELQEALTRKGLQLDDLSDSLVGIARIPRYFQRCIELRDEFGSFDVVTKEMVLWADLLDKIETDPQIKQRLGWHRAKDAQEILSDLAKKATWTNFGPLASVQLLEKYFPSYPKVRHDLEERGIALEAGPLQAKLSPDHIVLGWALYLANLFDCTEFTGIKDFAEGFQNALEPIPSEDLRTEALFVALQITAISADPEISQDQLSQKRAALMLAWFHSHNAQITDERLSFWAKEDPDAYAQVVEFEFGYNNSRNHEDALIAPLAETWLNKKGDLNRLASRLTKWLLSTSTDDTSEDVVYTHVTGQRLPRKKVDIQFRLLDTARSILARRPERQFLKTLAHCYAILHSDEKFSEDISKRAWFYDDLGKLMRWRYTEEVLGDLYWLAELAQSDPLLLKGVYGLADSLRVDFFPRSERPLTEEDKKHRTFVEQWNRRFKPYINRIRDQERLLKGESPAANVEGNYHGLGYLAVRTDLPDLRSEDMIEIKKLLHYISANAQLGRSRSASLEGFCIENLIPWVAKYAPEDYSAFACSFKINALNPECLPYVLLATQGLIFQQDDCEKLTEAILKTRQYLAQEDDSSLERARLLTEILLFSAPEEKLIDWFEFLASHKPLRVSTCYEPLPYLLEQLLPKSIVKLARQKSEALWSSASDNQTLFNGESQEFSEEEFWCWIYLCASDNDEDTTTSALENLKRRKSDIHTITFYFLCKATLDTNRFLSEILVDKEVRKHLFLKDGCFFSTPIYEGENSYSYEDLVAVLPQEVVGSFFCSPKRRADLSRWGKELMARMCSSFQGNNTNCNSVEDLRFTVNRKVLRIWAEQNTTDFLQLVNEYFALLSKSGWYCRGLYDFMDTILCLLLRFQPDRAMNYYHHLKTEGVRTIFFAYGGVETFFAQLWRVEECRLSEHHDLRRKLLEECLNDEQIMFMTLAALVGEGEEELWSLVTEEYLASPYAKERNLGISILPWFGNDKAIEKLEQLKSDDPSQWVRGHAWWAYEVAQQERSCREVYREALRTHDLFRISAVFEQIKPALSPTARWWHREIEKEEGFHEESLDIDPKLEALHYRFWYRWGNSTETKRNIEVFGRKLQEYCRGEKLSAGSTPRIAPWWKSSSD